MRRLDLTRLGDTVAVKRRRLAVAAAVLATLAGEWLGHSLSYFRAAGLAGLQAGLTSGVHDYMVPLGVLLLIGAAATATMWARAWVTLGSRLDQSVALIRSLLRGARPSAAPRTARLEAAPSLGGRWLALALPMAVAQCGLYVLQENVEQAVHGIVGGGLAPLAEGFGAAAWIQTGVAALMAGAIVFAMRVLRSRIAAVDHCEHLVRALWLRAHRRKSSAPPRSAHVIAARLLPGTARWVRPPPVPVAA